MATKAVPVEGDRSLCFMCVARQYCQVEGQGIVTTGPGDLSVASQRST